MDTDEKMLSFLDLLDLDEEVIDARLKNIMNRNNFTNKHLLNAIHLLQYKYLINLQEESECENHEERTFVAKLLIDVHEDNIENVCKIVNLVLDLNRSSVISNSEHLIQQMLANIDMPSMKNGLTVTEEDCGDEAASKALLYFKLCNSILDVVIRNEKKLFLPFLEIPLENVLVSSYDKTKIYFLNSVVPKIFKCVNGYHILDKIWNFIKKTEKNSFCNALQILSSLSDFYLPVADNEEKTKFKSVVVLQYEFWNILLNELMSEDPASRKRAVYLLKRSIDSIITLKKDVNVSSEICILFNWTHKDMEILRKDWNNFFVLIESLEEKQSNIVLPSLHLFETFKYVNNCWINCAFKIGLKHDNTKVRIKCIEYRLKTNIDGLSDTHVLLEALNDINLYDDPRDCDDLKSRVSKALHYKAMVLCVVKVLPYIKWSPVPLLHLSDVISNLNVDLSHIIEATQLSKNIMELLKIPCNNLPIKHAIKVNITHFVGHCCKNLKWRDYINIYNLLEWDKYKSETLYENPFIVAIENLNMNSTEKDEFFKTICKAHENIRMGLIYLEKHTNDINLFMDHVNKKILNIHDINNRQYSRKKKCFDDVVFVTHLFEKSRGKDNFKNIFDRMSGAYSSITNYIFSLAQDSDVLLSVEEISSIFQGYKFMDVIKDDKIKEVILGMYRHMIIVLTNKNVELQKKVYAMSIIEMVTKQLHGSDKSRIFSLKQIMHVMKHAEIKDTTKTVDVGRSRNAFYEKSCKIVHIYLDPKSYKFNIYLEEDEIENFQKLKHEGIKENLKELVDFVENVTECGGYGCLKWILKIMYIILPEILDNNSLQFNITEYIERMWREIEDLKSNNQYNMCIREFARLIIQEPLLKKSEYRDIIIFYSSKMIEYGPLKTSPVYFLALELNNKVIGEDIGHIIHILCDILLFSPVPKKDQRIAENVVLRTFQNPKYNLDAVNFDEWNNYDILCSAIDTLSKIRIPEIHETIAALIIKKIEDHFKTKQRYHGNSLSHRLFLIGLQHLLYLPLSNQGILDSESNANWVIDLLGKIPHQPSVKTCLEWYISLHFYVKNIQLDQNVVHVMMTKNIPLTSLFMILFWTLKHKMLIGLNSQAEFEFVMDFLLSHTMGQMFNIRLHAQYLASELFKKNNVNSLKYGYIIDIIQKTFIESAKDKNFVRLNQDFFVNEFDIVSHYTPFFIYYFLPRYYGIGSNEDVDTQHVRVFFKCINNALALFDTNSDIKREYLKLRISDDEILKYNLPRSAESSNDLENSDIMGTIQKKYTPWKNMSDIDILNSGKKKQTKGELIVVASLIDKLPNLGGMARTCEVFGIKAYVVNSLRYLQDKTFQGLSVSAERWVNIEEVRPGSQLKEYLSKKKTEGYSIVAAEQTSTSVQLHQFQFPKRTLLLLGHEKEGIPCDLLPMMDNCVEIPQQGFVRSLNVHVTAAIFVWEYSRQNVL